MTEVYEDEMIDVEVGPVGKTGLPTITDRPVRVSPQQELMDRQMTIQWLNSLHPLTRIRLLSRYWTWDRKGYRRALLGSTVMSRVVLHHKLNPAYAQGYE